MLEQDLIKQLIEQLYPISVAALHSLQQHDLDWRGIYHVEDTYDQQWVLRIVQRQEPTPWLAQPAVILSWLAEQGYRAPHVLTTSLGKTVGVLPQWWTLMTSYVDGEIIAPIAADLRLLGATVAQLHRIPLTASPQLPRSWWDRDIAFSATHQRLAAGLARTPSRHQPLIRQLLASVERLQGSPALPISLIHGDCWQANAVRTPQNTLVLIDWDCAGLGPAVLDLGNMLLTCHYDLSAPLLLKPDEQRIQAIVEGYQMHRRLMEQERAVIVDAVRFPLAFHAGNYLEQVNNLSADDLFMQKLNVRFDITNHIGQVAKAHLDSVLHTNP